MIEHARSAPRPRQTAINSSRADRIRPSCSIFWSTSSSFATARSRTSEQSADGSARSDRSSSISRNEKPIS